MLHYFFSQYHNYWELRTVLTSAITFTNIKGLCFLSVVLTSGLFQTVFSHESDKSETVNSAKCVTQSCLMILLILVLTRKRCHYVYGPCLMVKVLHNSPIICRPHSGYESQKFSKGCPVPSKCHLNSPSKTVNRSHIGTKLNLSP